MKPKVILQNYKRTVFITLVFVLISTYIFLRLFYSGANPLIRIGYVITNPFLVLIEKIASYIFQLSGQTITFQNHSIFLEGKQLGGITSQLMYKKVTIFYILILWLTRATTLKKVSFTGIYLVLFFLSSLFFVIREVYAITGDFNSTSIVPSHSIVFFCMNTVLLIWYLVNKKINTKNIGKVSVISNLVEKKLPDIIVILYSYSFLILFLGLFHFNLWIEILLKSAQGLLRLFGYNSEVSSNLLIGNRGSISVYRTCLGIMTMFLFFSLVYLTRNKNRKDWYFIFSGLLILNLANLIRIVLLFIHIQRYGDYMLTIDIHDLFNYVIYLIVFILWVIWFEKFMNVKAVIKGNSKYKMARND